MQVHLPAPPGADRLRFVDQAFTFEPADLPADPPADIPDLRADHHASILNQTKLLDPWLVRVPVNKGLLRAGKEEHLHVQVLLGSC